MNEYLSANILVPMAAAIILAFTTGCTTGMRFSVGFAPVTAISETQELEQQKDYHK